MKGKIVTIYSDWVLAPLLISSVPQWLQRERQMRGRLLSVRRRVHWSELRYRYGTTWHGAHIAWLPAPRLSRLLGCAWYICTAAFLGDLVFVGYMLSSSDCFRLSPCSSVCPESKGLPADLSKLTAKLGAFSWEYFHFDVNQSSLSDASHTFQVTVDRTSPLGDPDIYIRHGAYPTVIDYDFADTLCDTCEADAWHHVLAIPRCGNQLRDDRRIGWFFLVCASLCGVL